MEALKLLPVADQCRLYFNRDPGRCEWMMGMMARMKDYYHKGEDFYWMFAYGLFLYSKQQYSGRHAAMACICLACKQLDDNCPEIGNGDYERQIPYCTGKQLARVEKKVLSDMDYRTLASRTEIEDHLLKMMVASGFLRMHTI
tara:strand:- start:1689 stop:2117 length:429 start_codon:yes stop_codon:yes gene_type:complete